MAWYSLGCVYTELQDDTSAINAYLRAGTLFPDTTVRYHALCHHNLGRHYLNRRMLNDASSSFRLCKSWAVNQNDSTTVGYCDYYLGLCALYGDLHEKSNESFLSVIANRHSAHSSKTRAYLHLAKIECYIRNNYDLALNYLDNESVLELDPKDLGANYSVRADIHIAKREFDSAYIYSARSLECLSEMHVQCQNHHRMANLACRIGFPADSIDYHIKQYAILLDSIHKQRQQSEINDIRNNHSITLMEQELRLRHIRLIFIIILIGILIISITVLVVANIDRHRKARYIQLINKLRTNRIKLWESVLQSDSLPIPSATLAEHIASDLAMCKQLYDATSCSHTLKQQNQMRIPTINGEERQSAIDTIKTSFMDVIGDLRQANPKLRENEQLYCIFKSLGYSTRLIAVLLLRSESGLRNNKARLKEKLPEDIYNIFFQ